MGRATSMELAKMGYRIIIQGRDPEKTKAAAEEIKAGSGNQNVEFIVSDISSVKRSVPAVVRASGVGRRHVPTTPVVKTHLNRSTESSRSCDWGGRGSPCTIAPCTRAVDPLQRSRTVTTASRSRQADRKRFIVVRRVLGLGCRNAPPDAMPNATKNSEKRGNPSGEPERA